MSALLPATVATRYLQPLREGGSLPAVVDTDQGLFVVKFRGAGQGPRALIAELITALIARTLGLPMPEPALVELPSTVGTEERDPEITDLLDASRGVNVGLRYLDGAFNFDPSAAGHLISPELAAQVVWLDAYLTNPDRTPRNPNLMIWDRRPWLIDHGAALYVHHSWERVDDQRTRSPFPLIREHVLLDRAGDLRQADATLSEALTGESLQGILEAIPASLLMDPTSGPTFSSAEAARSRYLSYLRHRLAGPRAFVDEMVRAQEERRRSPPTRLAVRR